MTEEKSLTDFDQMMKDLTTENEPVEFGKYTFYVRPMTVAEYNIHTSEDDKFTRDEQTILRCTMNKNGSQLFSDIEQVKKLNVQLRRFLIGSIAHRTLYIDPAVFEKK
ncbi:cytochrome [Kluyvera cryocrescens]|uniref:cytochrome n=1 Tax=Kluyvera cryocrescens TaxID=580 RepID=UPI002DBD883B|nr:cytochrome [Kluyvera cryocrescens]MEB7712334.1 cytochrome [Kluyvera cryocrescens]